MQRPKDCEVYQRGVNAALRIRNMETYPRVAMILTVWLNQEQSETLYADAGV